MQRVIEVLKKDILLLINANIQAKPNSTSWDMQQANDISSSLNFNYEWSEIYYLPSL